MTTLSQDAGPITQALLEETIGANLARAVADPATARRWSTARAGRRWTYAELDRDVDACARGLLAAGRRPRATGSASGRRTAPSGCSCSTPPPGRRDPGQHQPRLPDARAGVRAEAVRDARCWSRAGRSRAATTPAMVDEVRGDCPELRDVVYIGDAGLGRAARPRREPSSRRAARARGDAVARRPDQHPVHLGHDRLPQGRDAVAPQHPQQRLLRRRADRLHRAGPGLHAGAVLPLLRHGDGQPRLPPATARAIVIPAPAFDPAATLRRRRSDERCTSLYGVPTMFIASWPARLRDLRPVARCAPASWPARRARSR